MKEYRYDAAIVGAGAAGMAAALALSRRGRSCALIDREDSMGGILLQCVHNGFGLRYFGEELTGPEFALRLERDVRAASIPFFGGTTVLSIDRGDRDDRGDNVGPTGGFPPNSGFTLLLSSASAGVSRLVVSSVVLAMGSRERNRGNVRIAGDRPSGVFTAGLVQHLLNIDGYLPGKRAAIIGSGDIGLIMARRLTLSGVKVEAVVEIQDCPSGLTRNVVQCLEDFSIPLYLSHATLRILGRSRVTGIEVAPLANGAPQADRAFTIPCDTVLLSVGLVPENELSAKAGVALNPVTNGPIVDSRLMTNIPGVFAAGNVLHIHDLVDRVVEEASRAGESCADWLAAGKPDSGETSPRAGERPLRAGANVRYTVPSSVDPARGFRLSLRSMVQMERGILRISRGGRELFAKGLSWIRPGEMISLDVPPLGGDAETMPFEASLAEDGLRQMPGAGE